ncbi:MAG TPA: hypothetical protein VJ728_15730 [Candidatus Binataceae bacterium]|nr:hypothetical protein [Candidatus Binataceae bacterium]
MRRERIVVGGLLLLLLILWLGFLVHRSPRFPGSLTGGVLAITGALLMLVFPLAYAAAKRIPAVKKVLTRRISIATLLTWHLYTGIVGSILAIVHTGHRFESNLGIVLTAMMLLTVFSGYIGRHFLSYVTLELREKQALLNKLATFYNQTVAELAHQPDRTVTTAASHGLFTQMFSGFIAPKASVRQGTTSVSYRAIHLAESIADVEYAIKTHELFKRRSAVWLKVHIATSAAFYVLLILHVWAEVYFGLRWFT